MTQINVVFIFIYLWIILIKCQISDVCITKKPPFISIDNNIFSETEFKEILMETKKLQNLLKNETIFGTIQRQNVKIPLNNKIYDIIYSTTFINKIKYITNEKKLVPSFYPIEYRKYLPNSYMNWHKDYVLHKTPQYECVLTLENIGDSIFEYINNTYKISTLKTSPNMLVTILADDLLHRVTETTFGYRTILKFIFSNSSPQYCI
jgi:hypothetical protein